MNPQASTTGQFNNLIAFRQVVYGDGLTRARDARFELMDALLLRPSIRRLGGGAVVAASAALAH